jgi:hypothetical protein
LAASRANDRCSRHDGAVAAAVSGATPALDARLRGCLACATWATSTGRADMVIAVLDKG